jgi:anti-sigma B factor antagonist
VRINSEGNDPVVVSIAGEVDLATAPDLATALEQALATTGTAGVRVDCSEVEFMDSAGLRVLIAARGAAGERDRPFELRDPSEQVRRLMEIAGLNGVFGLS